MLALFRGAVRERVGHDVALGSLLQAVVADRRGGAQRRLEVALFEECCFCWA